MEMDKDKKGQGCEQRSAFKTNGSGNTEEEGRLTASEEAW